MRTPGILQVATADASAIFDRQVAIMVRLAHRGALVAVGGVSLLGTILVPVAGWPRFLTWAALVLGALATRACALMFIARRRIPVPTRHAEQILTATTALLGLCVASGAFFFYPVSDFQGRALVTLILCAWPAAGAAVLGAHPRSFLWYLGCYFPTLGSAWLIYEPGYPAVFLLMLLFGSMLALLSREIGRLVLASVALEREKDRLLLDKDSLLAEKDALIAQLDLAKVRAEEADLYKSRFLAAASHDLRQPVTALTLLSGSLAEITVEPEARDIARHVVEGLDSLEALFNAILDLSKLRSGAIEVNTSPVAVAILFADLQREFAARFAANKIHFRVRPDATWLLVDRILLERILRNLLDNALKYTITAECTDGKDAVAGKTAEVVLEARADGDTYVLAVRDTGPGIAPTEQERIFGDFYQLNRASHGGLGLGLALVRGFADALGVKVRLDSAIDRGSTFAVEFPAEMRVAAPPAATVAPARMTIDLRQRLIVVIDDNEHVRRAFVIALERWGAQTAVAGTIEEALAYVGATGREPDLVIADFHLAGSARGTDAIAAFRERYADVAALIITGDGIINTLQATGIVVMQKPIAYDTLGSRIASLLAKTPTSRQGERAWDDWPNPLMR